MKIYTADEIAALLKVDYKTVLNLIKRGRLKALPGIRHKRITEEALSHCLGIPASSAPFARPAEREFATDKTLVSPTAKAVAPPLASASQRKMK